MRDHLRDVERHGLRYRTIDLDARSLELDYGDKLPPRPWYIFAPPRRYIITPPLTPACGADTGLHDPIAAAEAERHRRDL